MTSIIKPVSCRQAGYDLNKKPLWVVILSDGTDLSWVEGDKFVMKAHSEEVRGKMKHYREKTSCSKYLTLVKYAVNKKKQPKC